MRAIIMFRRRRLIHPAWGRAVLVSLALASLSFWVGCADEPEQQEVPSHGLMSIAPTAEPPVAGTQEAAEVDDPAEKADSSTPQIAEPAPTPSPPVATSSSASYIPATPFHGDTSIEEKIFRSAVIVKATLASLSSDVVGDADNKYGVVLKFNLSVSEYLEGTGPSNIVAVWVDGRSYDTRTEADGAKAVILAERDDQWDGREAVIFLYDGVSGFGSLIDKQLQLADHFLLAFGDPYSPDNRYSLHSKVHKVWLPAASHASSTGDSRELEFLLDVPSTAGDVVASSSSTTPTITLSNLKKRITEVAVDLSGGDGSEAYKECVRKKYEFERQSHYLREVEGRELYDKSPQDSDLTSGQPASAVLHERNWYGTYPDIKARTWLEGKDAALFTVMQGEATPNDSNGDGVLTAGVDQIRYMESFLIVRPLPAGEYKIDRKEVWGGFLPCNYVLSHDWTVTVTAPAGTLHEAFFDPVTVGSAIAADATNGVLKPTAFTDGNGASATLQRIAWEAGTVKLKLSPHTALADHVLDFIALDGTVSLSLDADEATVDAANNTLSWPVSSQPWKDGDKLMLRIHDGRNAGVDGQDD